MLQNSHFPQENNQCRMDPENLREMEGTLALRTRGFSVYFQQVWDRGTKEVPGRKQPSIPVHPLLEQTYLSGTKGVGGKKNNTGLQGAEITTHASPGTWTSQIAQKEIIFLKRLSSLMPFFGFFWQTIPSSASTRHSLSTALPTWECCGRKFDWTRESNLQELRNWHSFSPS